MMHVLERMAIENLAKQLFDDNHEGLGTSYKWHRETEKSRDGYRQKAEKLLNEGYYTDDR
jgi:hypothetical protein